MLFGQSFVNVCSYQQLMIMDQNLNNKQESSGIPVEEDKVSPAPQTLPQTNLEQNPICVNKFDLGFRSRSHILGQPKWLTNIFVNETF